jgi:hypothetical protein
MTVGPAAGQDVAVPEGGTSNGGSMHVRIRRTASLVALALAAGFVSAVGGTAAPAAAAASWPTMVLSQALPGVSRPTTITAAGGRIFVTEITSASVRVFTAGGAPVGSIAGINVATAAVASADGSLLYIGSDDGFIRVVDTASLAVTATWPTSVCGMHSLVLLGTALYFTYGCQGDIVGGLNHVDVTTGTVHDPSAPDAITNANGTRLAYDASTLWAYEWDGTLHAWTVAGGQLTDHRSVTGLGYAEPSLSAHGSTLVVASGQVRFFSAADLSLQRTLTVASSSVFAASFSPDGSVLVGALWGPRMFVAWDPSTGAEVFSTAANPAISWEPAPFDPAWSPDGAGLFALASTGTEYALVATPLTAPAAQPLTLTVAAPAAYGRTSTFFLKGRPGARVTLRVASNATTSTRVVTLSETGRAIVSSRILTTYRVSASTPATFEQTATAVAARTFVVPSAMTVASARSYKVVNGVSFYHRVTDAKHGIHLVPAYGARIVSSTAWKRSGGRWIKVVSNQFSTSSTGSLALYLGTAKPGVTYRFTFRFAGDYRNGPSSGATKPFRIG